MSSPNGTSTWQLIRIIIHFVSVCLVHTYLKLQWYNKKFKSNFDDGGISLVLNKQINCFNRIVHVISSFLPFNVVTMVKSFRRITNDIFSIRFVKYLNIRFSCTCYEYLTGTKIQISHKLINKSQLNNCVSCSYLDRYIYHS